MLLKVDTLITCLDLRSNQLGGACAYVTVGGSPRLPLRPVAHLVTRHMGFTDAGCAYLSESLRHNKRLTKLVRAPLASQQRLYCMVARL